MEKSARMGEAEAAGTERAARDIRASPPATRSAEPGVRTR
jgi:hypothetical protein